MVVPLSSVCGCRGGSNRGEEILVRSVGSRQRGDEHKGYSSFVRGIRCAGDIDGGGILCEIDTNAVSVGFIDERCQIGDICEREPCGPGLVGEPALFILVCTNELLCNALGDPAAYV